MFALIPIAWKIGGIAFLIALVAGGYFAWAAHERSLGEAALALKNAHAVIAQREIDAKENAKVVAQLAQKLQDTETKVITVTEKIYAAPVTRDCAQSAPMRAANDGIRQLFNSGAGPVQAGGSPQPLAPMPRSGFSAGQPKR